MLKRMSNTISSQYEVASMGVFAKAEDGYSVFTWHVSLGLSRNTSFKRISPAGYGIPLNICNSGLSQAVGR